MADPSLYLDVITGTRVLPEGTHWNVQVLVTWNKELDRGHMASGRGQFSKRTHLRLKQLGRG